MDKKIIDLKDVDKEYMVKPGQIIRFPGGRLVECIETKDKCDICCFARGNPNAPYHCFDTHNYKDYNSFFCCVGADRSDYRDVYFRDIAKYESDTKLLRDAVRELMEDKVTQIEKKLDTIMKWIEDRDV